MNACLPRQLDEIKTTAGRIYLVPDQAKELLSQIRTFVSVHPDEDLDDVQFRRFMFGFIEGNYIIAVNVKRVANNLHQSQRWVREFLNTCNYYLTKRIEENLNWVYDQCFYLNDNIDDWEFYEYNFNKKR